MPRYQERSRGNYDQRPFYGDQGGRREMRDRYRDDDRYAAGPRDRERWRYDDEDRDRDRDRDRVRGGGWESERYDENRFSQEEDDRAGRSWHGMNSEYDIDDTGRFHPDYDQEGERRGRYRARSPNYDEQRRDYGVMRGMRGERDQFGRYTGDERYGGWQQRRRGDHWQDRGGWDRGPMYGREREREPERRYGGRRFEHDERYGEPQRYYDERRFDDDRYRGYDRPRGYGRR